MPQPSNSVLLERLNNLILKVEGIDSKFSNYPTARELELQLEPIKSDIVDLRQAVNSKSHLVVDNSEKPDWKAVTALAIAVIGAIGTLYLTIRGAR